PRDLQLLAQKTLDRACDLPHAVAFASPDVEDSEVAGVLTGKLQSIDNVVNVDEVANDGPVSPNVDRLAGKATRDQGCDKPLVLDCGLKRPERIADPKHTIGQAMKVLVQCE